MWKNKGKDLCRWQLKRYIKEGGSVSSPTVSLEALFCTLIHDAHEVREIDTFCVLGA